MKEHIALENIKGYTDELREVLYLLRIRDEAVKGVQLHHAVAAALNKSPSSSEQVHARSVFTDAIKELNQQIGSHVYALMLRSEAQLLEIVSHETDQEQEENE